VSCVSLVAAAVCPQPPLLVPEVAAGAARELDELRSACDEAVARLLARAPTTVVLLGSGPTTREFPSPYRASFRRWGADVEAALGEPEPDGPVGPPGPAGPPMPLSLAVGVWLVRRALSRPGVAAGRVRRPTVWRAHAVAADASPAECAALGAALRSTADDWALLVLGDGSACRGEKAPAYDDARAEPFDKTVAQALATADADALRDLDPAVAAELRVAGRAPWQVLAAATAGPSDNAAATPWRGDLLYEAAPYGVAYFVASWARAHVDHDD
jgi:hypothetical protein